MQKRIWIAWERQRRSVELAKTLNCELFIIEYSGIIRYPKSIYRTLKILKCTKPDIVFVQNPSMILATVACIYKLITGTPVVVDRHTTFLLTRKYMNTPDILIFKLLHRFTIRFADLTIVTNEFLAGLVSDLSGTPFVLPDKIPELACTERYALHGNKKLLMISSFGRDEPIKELIEGVNVSKDESIHIFITGNYKKLDRKIRMMASEKVFFTGFLEEQEFINMIFSVDAVIALTTSDYCMLCACYEAVSAEKPLITSNKGVLREYFEGAIFVDNTAKGISEGINVVFKHKELCECNIRELKGKLIAHWDSLFANLKVQIDEISAKTDRNAFKRIG